VSGLTGQFYRQFALTIAISTVISAFCSLTLAPALSATLLRPHHAKPDALTRVMERLFGRFFRWFNAVFGRASFRYETGVKGILARKSASLGVYVLLVGAAALMFKLVPGGFVPSQDKGYLVGFAQLPEAASLDRSEAVIRRMASIALGVPGARNTVQFPGLSVNDLTNAPNSGITFVGENDPDTRTTKETSGPGIAAEINKGVGAIQDATAMVFPPPPVNGLGTIGGFKLMVEDRANLGYDELYKATRALVDQTRQAPELANVFSGYQINVPQLYADIDFTRARQLDVPLPAIYQALQVNLGSYYVNDFNQFGRTFQVRVQADAPFRSQVGQVDQIKVRTDKGEMVPLSSLVRFSDTYGPDRV
jgi:multidrug efflux pump